MGLIAAIEMIAAQSAHDAGFSYLPNLGFRTAFCAVLAEMMAKMPSWADGVRSVRWYRACDWAGDVWTDEVHAVSEIWGIQNLSLYNSSFGCIIVSELLRDRF
ncbi:MAG: hypothetical protein PUF51_02175 [Bifidobacteriaceae bacterium]|nr:hypothetical protein [Bifidobacteriaceae bacterium]